MENRNSRGFNFESTQISDQNKINTMLSLLAIAFAWAYYVGEWKNSIAPIKLKKHLRKSVSIFRYGLDMIRSVLLCHIRHKKDSDIIINMLRDMMSCKVG